jgi:hypothetical protein
MKKQKEKIKNNLIRTLKFSVIWFNKFIFGGGDDLKMEYKKQ